MNPVNLSFLESDYDVTVKGEIFDCKEPVVLSEDLLEIRLRNSDRVIDVGWYPEHDPAGRFRIVLYRGHTGYPLKEEFKTEIPEVIESIVSLIEYDRLGRDGVYRTSAAPESEVIQYG